MVNSPKFLLATTAFWNKFILALSLLFSGLSLSSQSTIEGERLRLFNEQFFAAQNAKNRDELDKAMLLFETLYQKDPENATVHYELAQLYAVNDEEEKAIFHAEQAHVLEDSNSWFFRLQIAMYQQFAQGEKLEESLKEAIISNPDEVDYHFQLAEAYYINGKPELAIEQLNILEEKTGVSDKVSNQKKSIYLEIGDLEGATNELNKLIRLYPKNMDYRGALGQIYNANGFEEKAFEQYLFMLAIDTLDPRPHLDLANYYQKKGNFDTSIFHLKKAMNSKQLDMERKIAVLLSLFEASQGDSSLKAQSFSLLDEIIAQEPEDPRVYAMYGDYLSRDGKDLEAISYYKKALTYGEKFQIWEQILLIEMQNRLFEALMLDAPEAIKSFPNQPLPYLLAGLAHNEKGESADARDFLEDGLNFVFNNVRLQSEFYLQLAAVNHKLENHSESDAYFDQVLAINPKHAGALNNYAYYLSLREERLNDALEMSELSNMLSPENPIYLDTKAWILHQLDRDLEAQKIIERALALMLRPEAELLEHYGDILAAQDLADLAREQYLKAQALEDSKRLISKLKQLP